METDKIPSAVKTLTDRLRLALHLEITKFVEREIKTDDDAVFVLAATIMAPAFVAGFNAVAGDRSTKAARELAMVMFDGGYAAGLKMQQKRQGRKDSAT